MLFGASVVFGGGPAPQNGHLCASLAQVPTPFPHLRRRLCTPAPTIIHTCANSTTLLRPSADRQTFRAICPAMSCNARCVIFHTTERNFFIFQGWAHDLVTTFPTFPSTGNVPVLGTSGAFEALIEGDVPVRTLPALSKRRVTKSVGLYRISHEFRGSGCKIAFVRTQMLHTPLYEGAYVAF
jgi:hypothetical protein